VAVAASETEIADLFPELSEAQLAEVLAKLQRHTFAAGATIIREGEVADRFYVLTKGEVEVWKARSDGPPQLVARLGSGECCGEIGILQGLRRTATVRAAVHTTVEAWSLDAASFLDLVRESDLTSAEIARLVHRRTLATTLAVALPALAPEQIARVSSDFRPLCYPPGVVIIRQGDPADRFFIIVKGRVEVLNHHPGGHDIHVGALAAGQYFGEVGLLQRQPRTATVRAAADTEVEVMALDADGFERLLAGSERTGEELALVMCERLVALAEQDQP